MGNFFSFIGISKQQRVYGWIKDDMDKRDHILTFMISKATDTITNIDLRENMPPVYDQGKLGSCTINALCGAYEYDKFKHNELPNSESFTPSRLFIYYNERIVKGTVDQDSGASIRDGIKSINRVGVCPESMWPYNIKQFAIKPTDDCYKYAVYHYSIEYKRIIQSEQQIKQCLIDGYPIIFGFIVYESFESPIFHKTGIMPMPQYGERVLGGHAVVCCGFDNEKKQFLIRNSWGPKWGPFKGYFWMPYEFLLNKDYCSDLWAIEKIDDKY